MQKLKNFTPAHPRIGLDRVFIKSPQLDPNKDIDVDESDKFENESQNDTSFIENLLLANSQKLAKYKGEGCVCIYDEKVFDFPKNKIYFSDLLSILTSDESSEIELDKYKGKWIDSINQMIPIENLKSFSENLFKFDPLFPLNIQFESRFECGNLRMAIKVQHYEYDLIVNNDTNSGKASNWFYFRLTLRNTGKVNLTEQPRTYKFNIINCQKTDTLFSKGLKVLCYSSTMRKWTRRTKSNYYFLNGITNEEKKLYTLTFTYKVDYNFSEENLYFAYCFPYSYTNLQLYLSSILNNPVIAQKNILRHEIIGKSLSENNLDMVIITKFDCNFDEIAFRQCIVLTARVHPGESNSSYAIQGVIDFLIDLKNPISEKLRKNFIFKIIPMLNPDGVINGNFRTSLVGKDLNRLWDEPKESVCPTIYQTKEMIKKTLLSREVYLFCDFHGHSNKPNFFLYGCPTSRKLRTQLNLSYQEMILSKIYFTKNDMFDHRSCIYKIAPKKMKTARAVVKNELNIDFSYCLESSIGYISIGENKYCFFTPKYYNKIGYDFCLALSDLTNKDIFNENLQKIQAEEAAKNATGGNNSNINFSNNNSTNNNNNNNNNLSNQNPINKESNNNNCLNNYANNSNNINSTNAANYNNNSTNNSGNNSNLAGNYFNSPNSLSYINLAINNLNINSNNKNNIFVNGNSNIQNANNQRNFLNSSHHSHSQKSLINNQINNHLINENFSVTNKKNLHVNEDSSNKSKKENIGYKDKEIKEKENRFTKEKEKEIFKHIPQNKDKNANSNYNNNRERDLLSNKNSKLLIKTPKDNSDINLNANNNLDSNRLTEKEKDKDKDKLKNQKIKITEKELKDKDTDKDKANTSKSELITTADKKSKKKKKKLNPLKTKKLFIAAVAASDNPNNTSNSNNQNNSNVPSLSSSFLNLNPINSNLIEAYKLSKNSGKLERISEKGKSNNQSANSTNANFMVKESDSSFYGNGSETPNLIALSKNTNYNNIPNINMNLEEYVKKVNGFSISKKINDNISRETENSLNSCRKEINIYSEKDLNRVTNNSSNFNNINDIKTNHDRTFSPDFHIKLNLGDHKGHRNNLSLKIENSEHSFNILKNINNNNNNNNNNNSGNSQTSPFSLYGGNSPMIPNLKNSIANSNSNNNINIINNILNSVSPNKNRRISIQIEKNKYFEGQVIDYNSNPNFISSKPNSNKNMMHSKFNEKNESNFSNGNFNNNDPNYFSNNSNTNNVLKSPNTLGAFGFMDINSTNKEIFNKNKNVFFYSNTPANNQSSEISDRSKAKSINAKIIDPSKIYLTPTQKIYKTLNDNHVLFVKNIPKNK